MSKAGKRCKLWCVDDMERVIALVTDGMSILKASVLLVNKLRNKKPTPPPKKNCDAPGENTP